MTDPKKLIAEIRNQFEGIVAKWNVAAQDCYDIEDDFDELEAWVNVAQGEIQEYEKGAEI